MTTGTSSIIAFLAFALIFQTGYALKCWTCSSDRSPECADPLNITEHAKIFLTRDCETTASQNSYGYNERYVCKKIVQKDNGRTIVRRSCEIPNPEERDITNGPCGPHTTQQNHVSMESCFICNTDLCNSAISITGSRVIQFFTIFLIISGVRSFSF